MKTFRASMAGLLVACLLMVTGTPAAAQVADPMRPAAAGVLLPFFSDPAAGFVSVLQVISPLGGNNPLHMVFFSATCVRNSSVADELTLNQAKAYISSASPLLLNFNGLATIARSLDGNNLLPLTYPLHTRVHWIDTSNGRLRALEPITLDTFLRLTGGVSTGLCGGGFDNGFCWNPLGSAATFVTPQETSTQRASIILICPRSTIQSSGGGGVFAVSAGFPRLINRDGSFGFPPSDPFFGTSTTRLRAEIYDDNEALVRDLEIPCDCLTTRTLASIDGIYSTPPTNLGAHTVPVWYTVLKSTTSGPAPGQHTSFTGYWNLEQTGPPATLFNRMSSASRDNLDAGTDNPFGNR